MSLVPDAITNGIPEVFTVGRSRAEMHALGFLARYRNPRTRKSYETSLRQWFQWCDEAGLDPIDATRTHIELFARDLEMSGRTGSTVGTKLNALAGFYRYAVIDRLIDADPMAHVARPAIARVSTTQGLNRTEFADLLRAAEAAPNRDHALVCILGLNGCRVSEACGLDIEHLGSHHGSTTFRILRKGGKHQTLPMAPRTQWQVELTIAGRTSGPVFLTREGHRMDRRTAGRIVARLTAEAGIRKRITPHSLRHTFVTLSLDAGQAERDIAISTGHADSRMVAYYDRGRESIARNTTHAVAAWVEGAV